MRNTGWISLLLLVGLHEPLRAAGSQKITVSAVADSLNTTSRLLHDVDDSDDYNKFDHKRKPKDSGCVNSSSLSTNPSDPVCIIDIYVVYDPSTKICAVQLTDEVDVNDTHTKITWIVKNRHKKEDYVFEFVNDYKVPAIIFAHSDGFLLPDKTVQNQISWTRNGSVKKFSSEYLILLKWSNAKLRTKGLCQYIDPVIANS